MLMSPFLPLIRLLFSVPLNQQLFFSSPPFPPQRWETRVTTYCVMSAILANSSPPPAYESCTVQWITRLPERS